MGAMSESEIVEFYSQLNDKHDRQDVRRFREFLDQLFAERDLSGCTFFTSHFTFCIVRYPTYSQWRFKPLLSLGFHRAATC